MATLSVLQHNVLSWTFSRRYELYNTYREIDPDVILINAHSLKDGQRIKIFNYDVYQTNHLNEHNAGAAIAVRKNLKHQIWDDLEEDYLAIKVLTPTGHLIIATGYQPPRLPHLPAHTLLRLFRNNSPVILAGDLNARHRVLGHDNNNPAGEFINQLIRRGNTVHIGPNFKTFITSRSSGTPDIILTNNKFTHNIHVQPGPITSSDHIPVLIKISTSPIQIPVTPRPNYNRANWENFTAELERMPTPELNGQPVDCIDEKLSTWTEAIKTAMRNHIPIIRYRTLPHPRVTEDINLLRTAFNNLRQRAENTGWTQQLQRTMKILQSNLTELISQQRDQMWDELLKKTESVYKQPDQFWKQVRQLSGSETTGKISYLLDPHGTKLYTSEHQANEFKRHLSNIFRISPEENQDFCPDTENEVNNYLENSTEHLHYDTVDYSRLDERNLLTRPITRHEVQTVIKTLKNRKAPGLSRIDRTVLTHLPVNMLDYLVEIFNASLSAGFFPSEFKIAIIKMLLKKGKQSIHPVNYRPISLLETTGKVYEKILNARLKLYLHDNDYYNPDQHAYQHNRGTASAIAVLYQRIALTQQDHNHQCNLISRDISKAFDKIWFPGMKYKLCQLNMPRIFTASLCSFLDDRSAVVQINDHITAPFQLQAGVPQGAVLSPTLFNIYTSDIKHLRHSKHVAYADDVSQIVSYHGPSKLMLKLKTERAITELNEIERKWKIRTNSQKFQILHISRCNPPPLNIGNIRLNYARETTVLGFKMKGRGIAAHVKQQRARASENLRKLRRFSKLRPTLKLRLYKALVLPIIDYPPVPTNTIANSNWRKFQGLQNKALRWVNNDLPPYSTTVEELHEKYQMEPINIRNHRLAKNDWDQIRREFPDETTHYEDTTFDSSHSWWPLAYIRADAVAPTPLYKQANIQPDNQDDQEDDDFDD